jgi:hypothetical protein
MGRQKLLLTRKRTVVNPTQSRLKIILPACEANAKKGPSFSLLILPNCTEFAGFFLREEKISGRVFIFLHLLLVFILAQFFRVFESISRNSFPTRKRPGAKLRKHVHLYFAHGLSPCRHSSLLSGIEGPRTAPGKQRMRPQPFHEDSCRVVELVTLNRRVPGSSPGAPTKLFNSLA